MKKTIVIFLFGYYPGKNYGGPVTSIRNFTEFLSDEYDMRIITSNHELKCKEKYSTIKEGWNKVGCADVLYLNEKDYRTIKFEKILKPFIQQIDVFYLSSIYNIKINYPAIKLAHKYSIPILLAPRGDLMKNSIGMKSKAKMLKKLIFLRICRVTNLFKGVFFQSTSFEETEGIKRYLNISENRIIQVPNFPIKAKNEVKLRNKKKNSLKIVFISRIMVKKNLLLALDAVLKLPDQYNIKFDIFGPIEDKEYWKTCQKVMDTINLSENKFTEYKGNLPLIEAQKIYEEYECFLFPTISENYGHVIAEAMISNCPVIISKCVTPFDDCNGHGNFTASLENPEEFVDCLSRIAEMDQVEYDQLLVQGRNYANQKFRVDELKEDYLSMIQTICNK